MGQYQNAHTLEWAATIGRFDGFVFVTPEVVAWSEAVAPLRQASADLG